MIDAPYRVAPSPETCRAHRRPATLRCKLCRAPVCNGCFTPAAGVVACQDCARPHLRRRRRRRALLALAALALLGAAALALFYGEPGPRRPMLIGVAIRGGHTPVLFDDSGRMAYGPGDLFGGPVFAAFQHLWERMEGVAALRERVARRPCDRRLATHLADALLGVELYRDTLALRERFTAACGRHEYLDWKVVHAREQLGEWAAAEAWTTGLIAATPADPDFWWWRGKQQIAQGDLAGGYGDLMQALAGREEGGESPLWDLARIAASGGYSCPAAFALRAHEERGGALRWIGEARAALEIAGDCAREDGRGRAVVATVGGAAVAEGAIGAARATMWIDPSGGLTVVGREAAARAGLTAGPSIEVMAFGERHPAHLARVDSLSIGGAAARAVDVAIVAQAPRGLDAIVGGDFLRRFTVLHLGGSIELRGRGAGR